MNIEYVNSSNKKVDLNSEPYKMLISDLLDYDWEMVLPVLKKEFQKEA